MSKTETVSAVEILRDYDRPMSVKDRARLADEIERLNGKIATALYRIQVLETDNAALVGANLALIARQDCDHDWRPLGVRRGRVVTMECHRCGVTRPTDTVTVSEVQK